MVTDAVMLRRQAAQYQAGQLTRRLVDVVEAMLQEQRIEVRTHDQIDRHHGFIEGRFALEVSALPTFLQDALK
ncbi:hypothetical protein D3C84_1169350 [compost metagenome]